jgi:hypothetical protein
MAGISAERQETAFVKAIKDAVAKNNRKAITVIAGGTKVEGVTGADKYSGRQSSGSEPYTDVILKRSTMKDLNLSLKGEAAPSLAGGGLRGLEAIVPGIAGKFMQAAYNQLIKDGLQKGDKVPDIYGAMSEIYKTKIVIGTSGMGGPIHYMYIGSMDVKSTYNERASTLTFNNGSLTESKKYAKTHDLFFRLRARREDQTFDPDAMKGNIPNIYGKSPSRGDSAGRIVITDKVPKNAKIVVVR